MLRYYKITPSMYKIKLNTPNKIKYYMGYVSECQDNLCIYSRHKTKLRSFFEKCIYDGTIKNKNNILFYGSFKLLQELRLIALLKNHISEIHFVDKSYSVKISLDFYLTFIYFLKIMNNLDIQAQVYVHTDFNNFTNNFLLHKKFDIICGIDIDYIERPFDDKQLIKEIANKMLKAKGRLYLTQNFTDQIELHEYEIINQKIKLIKSHHYVKPPYYFIYKNQQLICDIGESFQYIIPMYLICRIYLRDNAYALIIIIIGIFLWHSKTFNKKRIISKSILYERNDF